MLSNNSLLIPIQPVWVKNIIEGLKWIEVRKTKPKLDNPFTMYIYCTKDNSYELCYCEEDHSLICGRYVNSDELNLNGKIIGEASVIDIEEYTWDEVNNCYHISDDSLMFTCLTKDQLKEYGKRKTLYGYKFASVVYYKKPLPLEAAYRFDAPTPRTIKLAPQTWMYIAGING